MSKFKMSRDEERAARMIRWKCRTDLGFLCREVLGYKDVLPHVHQPVLDILQQFPFPTREQFQTHDVWDGEKWVYKPLVQMQALPGERRVLLLDPRSHLKCSHPDTLVNLVDGSYKKAGDIVPGDLLWGIDDKTLKPCPTKVLETERQAPQAVYKIRFQSGRELRVSHEHPLRLLEGWVLAKNIKKGDRVGVINRKPASRRVVPEAEYLGWMTDLVTSCEYTGQEETIAIQTDTETLCLDDVITHNTYINAQAHSIQWLLNYPEAALAIFQSNLDKAQTILAAIKQIFLFNEKFRSIFPEYCPKRLDNFGTQQEFTTPARPKSSIVREPSIMALSIDKGAAGYHFDVMKFSDIVEPENVKTDERIKAVIDAFQMAKNLLVSPAYWIDVEGTRYHFGDLYGKIIDNWMLEKKEGRPHEYRIHVRGCYKKTLPEGKTFTPDTLDIPFDRNEKGEYIPIFEKDHKGAPRFTLGHLQQEERDDAYQFSCQKLNNPAGDGADVTFPQKYIVTRNTISPTHFKQNIRVAYRQISVDTGETTGPRSNPTAMVVDAVDGGGRHYVEHVEHGKMSPTEIVTKLFLLNSAYRPERIIIEETGFVRGLNAAIKHVSDMKGVYLPLEFIKRDNREAKTERIKNTLQPWYIGGDLRFVVDHSNDGKNLPPWWDVMLREMKQFPVGQSDDILDALADLFQNAEWLGRNAPRENLSPDERDEIIRKVSLTNLGVAPPFDEDGEYSMIAPPGENPYARTGGL